MAGSIGDGARDVDAAASGGRVIRAVARIALAGCALAGCAHAAALPADHPADPRAPIGQLADPPPSLTPGTVSYAEAVTPAARDAVPPGHAEHAGHPQAGEPGAPADHAGHAGHPQAGEPGAPADHAGHAGHPQAGEPATPVTPAEPPHPHH